MQILLYPCKTLGQFTFSISMKQSFSLSQNIWFILYYHLICWSKGSNKFACIFHHCPLAPTLLSTTLLTDHKKITRAMGNYSLSSLIWATLRCKQPKPDCLNTFPSWKQCECSMARHDVCPLQIMILLWLLFVLPWNNLTFNSTLIVQTRFFFFFSSTVSW